MIPSPIVNLDTRTIAGDDSRVQENAHILRTNRSDYIETPATSLSLVFWERFAFLHRDGLNDSETDGRT